MLKASDQIDPQAGILAAIVCLKDLGFSREEINQRIAKWILASQNNCHWRDLPPDAQIALGKAMQKYFESEFTRRKQAA